MENKYILSTLFRNIELYSSVQKHLNYICTDDAASNLLSVYNKKLYTHITELEQGKNFSYDDLDVVFSSTFESTSKELELWHEVKKIDFSDIDLIQSQVVNSICNNIKEYFFAKAFSEDNYDLEQLEELYATIAEIQNSVTMSTENTEEVLLEDIDKCCSSLTSQKTEGVTFFDSRVSDKLAAKQFDCGTLNVIMGAPGRGKTQIILNQGVHVASQGKYTLHIAIGDLTPRQLILRLLAIITNKPIQQISLLDTEQFNQFMLKTKQENSCTFEHLHSIVCLPNTLTGSELIKKIEAMQKRHNVHYTQVVIDYDGNIETDLSSTSKKYKDDSKSMYYAGADIYNSFVSFAKQNQTVVWILSQPKVQFWSNEKIPLEALSDSSKKGHIIDFCMSIGKKDITEDLCTLFCSKNRHGEANFTFFTRQLGSTQRFEPKTEGDW